MPRKQIKVSLSERMQAIMDNPELIKECDDEEISKGKLRDKNGGFKGRPMPMVPTKFYDILRREQMRRWEQKVAESLQPSLQVLNDVAQNKTTRGVPADARVKAAIYLIERAVGKVPDKVQATVEVKKWEEDIESLLYDPDKKEEAS